MTKPRIVLFVLTILILAATVFSFVFLDNRFLIQKYNIATSPPGFLDSRQFAWASESFAQGYDPMFVNPNNPVGHRLNYPRIWHVLFYLGINESHTNIIGTIVVLLFFAGIGVFWFSKPYDNLTYPALFLAFLSPATMLGVERSNIELILFLLLSLSLVINYRSSVLGLFAVLFASVLKLYPIFGLLYLLKENKSRFWKLFLSGMVIFILYGLLSLNDLRQVFNTTPQLVNSSFGINVWWMGIRHPRVFAIPLTENAVLIFKIITYVSALSILGGCLFLNMRGKASEFYKRGQYLDAFRMGAGIYAGCFLLMNTHDYRLIFLIFTIPQLIEWFLASGKKALSVPGLTLVAMGLSLWNAFIMRFLGRQATFVIEEFANWFMLTGLLYLLFASSPGWLIEYLSRPFSREERPHQNTYTST